MVMYANPNRSHAVSFVGFVSLRGDLVSGKVIRRGGGVLYAVVAREFHSAHKALANLRSRCGAWLVNPPVPLSVS